jgi:hypothetical protein
MNDFKIKPVALKPDHSFLTVHKPTKEPEPDADAFSRYKDYKTKIALLFNDLPQSHKFWLQTGESVKNLHELYTAFDEMPEPVYCHHVGKEKNDFVEWIKHVYQDDDLAFKLFHAKSRIEARAAIEARIDELTNVGTHTSEKGFFQALIAKFSKQNEKLEQELLQKKDWLAKKQKEMEAWEQKNIEHEKMLFSKYKGLEVQEQDLYGKFRLLQEQEEKLNQALMHERAEVERENKSVVAAHRAVEKEKDAIVHEKGEIDRQRMELEKTRREHQVLSQRVMMKQHEPLYGRLDELMGYATTCVFNKNYREARDSMAKVRYYYSSLPNTDPRKKEFYLKIIKLRKYINDELKI